MLPKNTSDVVGPAPSGKPKDSSKMPEKVSAPLPKSSNPVADTKDGMASPSMKTFTEGDEPPRKPCKQLKGDAGVKI